MKPSKRLQEESMARGNGRQDIVENDVRWERLMTCPERAIRRSESELATHKKSGQIGEMGDHPASWITPIPHLSSLASTYCLASTALPSLALLPCLASTTLASTALPLVLLKCVET